MVQEAIRIIQAVDARSLCQGDSGRNEEEWLGYKLYSESFFPGLKQCIKL